MRTKGKMQYKPTSSTLLNLKVNGEIVAMTFEEYRDDADHLLACWNEVEAIGGDPETVGELRDAFDYLVTIITIEGIDEPRSIRDALEIDKAILAKTK